MRKGEMSEIDSKREGGKERERKGKRERVCMEGRERKMKRELEIQHYNTKVTFSRHGSSV